MEFWIAVDKIYKEATCLFLYSLSSLLCMTFYACRPMFFFTVSNRRDAHGYEAGSMAVDIGKIFNEPLAVFSFHVTMAIVIA